MAVLCVLIDQYPGQIEPMLGKVPVQVLTTKEQD